MDEATTTWKEITTTNNNGNASVFGMKEQVLDTLKEDNAHPQYIPPIIDAEAMFYFRLICWSTICKTFCVFGVLTNTINIMVFVKTGFKDSINMSLFALAISDFGACFFLIFTTITMNPYLHQLDVPVSWDDVAYISGSWPHVAFTKITTLVTAFITFERCLCVSLPLKVKTIVTRKRVVAYLVSCYLLLTALMIPMFYCNQIRRTFYPTLNKTVVGLYFTENRPDIEEVFFPIINIPLSMGVFVFIIVTTIVLVVKLKEKTKWRLTATSAASKGSNDKTKEGAIDKKEQRVSKMVVAISTLFIACFLPSVAMQLVMWVEERVSIDGAYSNLNKTLGAITFTAEAVNSSMNIFFYYRNSSNYRTVFDRIFSRKKQ